MCANNLKGVAVQLNSNCPSVMFDCTYKDYMQLIHKCIGQPDGFLNRQVASATNCELKDRLFPLSKGLLLTNSAVEIHHMIHFTTRRIAVYMPMLCVASDVKKGFSPF